jgi:hypothetical protein
MSELKQRSVGTAFPAPKFASANKVLWQRTQQPLAQVRALSPSDAAVIAAMARLRPFTPSMSKARRRLPRLEPNDASVVLAVEVGDHRSLLGADLELCKDPGLGWAAILDAAGEEEADHQVFKVPHHASPTAHHGEVWNRMLVGQPWAATTPFVSGDVRLPSVSDCQRILARTERAYLTATPTPGKFHDPSRTVEKTVIEATIGAQFLPGRYGHVRLRKRIDAAADSKWNVTLFGDATTMEDYVQESH